MSYDLYLWRENRGPLSPSAIYARITEDLEVEELETLDEQMLRERLSAAFPGWDEDTEGTMPFQCVFSLKFLVVETWSSTPPSVIDWFQQLAAGCGLKLFDPQTDDVTADDIQRARAAAKQRRRQEDKNRWARELASLNATAAAGDLRSQVELGNRFAFGEGVKRNHKRAFEWYVRAARGGSFDGMFNLAACYQRGEGTPRDEQLALEWYERAAKGDSVLAPFALGEIYMDGTAVPRDINKAAEYFQLAYENGHPDAGAALKLVRRTDVTDDEKRHAWKFSKRE